MVLTKDQQAEFEKASRPLMAWLNNNCHPHVTVIVNCTNAELTEGVCMFRTENYIKD